MARKKPSAKQRSRIISANANRCCVCKRDSVGLHLHHIDGNSSNTIDENLAVLCVEDHDKHHRFQEYTKARHTELSAEELLDYKASWERFVKDARCDNPTVIAVINVFGDKEQIHAAKILFQWPDEKIEFERVFHLLEGDFNYWIDEMISDPDSLLFSGEQRSGGGYPVPASLPAPSPSLLREYTPLALPDSGPSASESGD